MDNHLKSTKSQAPTQDSRPDAGVAAYWRSRGAYSDDAEPDTRKKKHEHTHRYYSRVISLALAALDDGSQSPPPSRELIEWLLSALGYHCSEWTRLSDEELVRHIACAGRLRDELAHDRHLARIRKQRERLLKWQEKPDNPLLIKHELRFEHSADSEPGRPRGKTYSEYQLPFGELVAEIIAEAPPGTRDDRLKKIVKRLTRDYLDRFQGAAKREKKKREHSPESDLKRAATVARKAYEREKNKAGRESAINAFCAAFGREFGGILQISFSDNSNDSNNLTDKNHVTGVAQPSRDFCHVSEEKSVAKLSGAEDAGTESHPRSDGAAGRGCDSLSDPDVSYLAEAPEHRALSVFESVGAESVEYYGVDSQNTKVGAYNEATLKDFRQSLTRLLSDMESRELSLTARVRGSLLQIDDCDAEAVNLLSPFSFAVFETSHKNFQVWLAFADEWDKAEARGRLFEALKTLAPGANPGAGGALRWPGSVNFKAGRNGWRVRIASLYPGRITTPTELDEAGLLADPPAARAWDFAPAGPPLAWPDYDKCSRAKTTNGVVDRSRADAQFVYFALKQRRSPSEIRARLLELSPKAKEQGESYIERTVAAGLAYLGLEVSA